VSRVEVTVPPGGGNGYGNGGGSAKGMITGQKRTKHCVINIKFTLLINSLRQNNKFYLLKRTRK